MKIARFSHDGVLRFGVLDEDEQELVVLTGDPMFAGYDTTGDRVPLSEAKLLSPVLPRSKVVGAAYNYGEPTDATGDPFLFLKPNTSVIGPGDPIVLPPGVGPIWIEAELAVVIGRIAKQVNVGNALDYVFGYTAANDVTAIELMKDRVPQAKGYDTFTPLGPFIETDLDPEDVDLVGRVDGEERQTGNTSQLIHSAAELVAFASTIWTLLPGDVILTGTPGGNRVIESGQSVEVEVAGIGVLRNPAIARP
ncbi:fumarylacetoacetate hydrolase family protein [Herbiconiux sp. SYSU D00978]|uniref:fumarylacetoacetate hydrolase family protein n=1 Tax=Herbiconiux sp. SYSU D00978 TaxID=2812562 RepID=UPI001A965D28|nr:fumarylacetoacetate hydrolase family protein [Herbiconiux sp. SYSU D00978]